MNIKQLQQLLSEIDYPVLFEIDLESIWQIEDDCYIWWNSDGNLEEFEEQEGNTYGGELPEGFIRQGEYLICNVNTGCGQWVTRVLALDKEV